MSTIEKIDVAEDDNLGGYFSPEAVLARKREWRRNHKADFRKFNGTPPIKEGMAFAIVPEVAPILKDLAEMCAREANQDLEEGQINGIYILAARAAIVMKKQPQSVARRLNAIVNKRQLFVNAEFVECCLMAMDVEHEIVFGQWPSRLGDAIDAVAFDAELKGKKLSPDRCLAKANQLYEKGIRKALKRAPEVVV